LFHLFLLCSSSDPDKVLGQYSLSPEVKEALLKNITRRLTPQAVKIRADLEVMCFSEDGIEAIKEALLAGQQVSETNPEWADCDIQIKLVAPPLYVMMTHSLEKDKGIACLKEACDVIKQTVTKKGGEVNIKTEARAVSERDDRLLGILMETLEKQNQEIAGDSDVSDAED